MRATVLKQATSWDFTFYIPSEKKCLQYLIGVYRDEALVISKGAGRDTEVIFRKDSFRPQGPMGRRINLYTYLTTADFLEVTLDLGCRNYKYCQKTNDELTHINIVSCHPPTICKHLVKGVSKRIFNLSPAEEIFVVAAAY